MRWSVLIMCVSLIIGCNSPNIENEGQPQIPKIFDKIPAKTSGLTFTNEVKNTPNFNIFKYRNFYNGAGVAVGDINNDGLSDVYLTGNAVKNKLFLNKGNFQFEDITATANVAGSKAWSTGVVMVDINADGWLDIYVCNAGYIKGSNQENELFINQQDGTFKEEAAKYGLNDNSYTTHAAFFDYDMDGDLDAYILNNSFIDVSAMNEDNDRETYAEDWDVKDFIKGGGDKLMRNDNGVFTDVTKEANVYGSLIGFGLGITIGDINDDHLPDMYVSNDFYERDYLYINQGDGTFKEEIEQWMEHLSLSSMGADMADINNDGFPEIFVTEMLPDDEFRLKTTTRFEDFNTYHRKIGKGFHHQYMQNTLQYNNQNQSFSEIAHFAGVAASDWSWGALMFDADNDGYRDLYVCNGVHRDVVDQDFIDFFANEIEKMKKTGQKRDMTAFVEKMPSKPIHNKFFLNNQDLTFTDAGKQAGFDEPSFSNGAAYADLDNDGDLDLIVNNVNQPSFLFKNQTIETTDKHYITIKLKGNAQNTYAIGSKIFVYKGDEKLNFHLIPSRGFQSSVDYNTVFGLGNDTEVDSVVVLWYDQSKTVINNPTIDQTLVIDYTTTNKINDSQLFVTNRREQPIFENVENNFQAHVENKYTDFFQEGLVIKMLSKEGPKAVIGDVNGDGLEDVFIGGAVRQVGQMYLQTENGFVTVEQPALEKDARYEDTAAELFDADGDGDLDLYVGSGGNHAQRGSSVLKDRIYLNDGKGVFSYLPFEIDGENTGCVVPMDYDDDGDLDLFVGSRSWSQNYGVPPKSFIFENDGKGRFTNISGTVAPNFYKLGMITDAKWIDITGDTKEELIVVGEWMTPQIYQFKDGQFVRLASTLDNYAGWWYAIEATDIDADGDIDLVLGNRGENFYFSGSKNAPAKLWLKDFDENGTVEKIITRNRKGRDMPVPLKKELTEQLASLKKKNLRHTEFANKSMQELFPSSILKKAYVLEGNYFQSAIALNDGSGNFEIKALPSEVQFSCVCDIYCTDLNGDNLQDIVMAGNDASFLPQFSKLDASYGHVLMNKGNGAFDWMPNPKSGFFVRGDVKGLEGVKINGENYLLTLINSQQPKLFKIQPQSSDSYQE